MKWKSRLIKDLNKRRNFRSLEIKRLLWSIFNKNQVIGYKNNLESSRGSLTIVRNRCVITGSGRSIITKWGLNRWAWKMEAESGRLRGVIKN